MHVAQITSSKWPSGCFIMGSSLCNGPKALIKELTKAEKLLTITQLRTQKVSRTYLSEKQNPTDCPFNSVATDLP